MTTRWTLDHIPFKSGEYPAAYLYVLPPEDNRQVVTVDLQGCHVLLDVDAEGDIAGLEIIGPAVRVDLAKLGDFLKAEPEELTEGGQEDHE
jgi:uncharacterized protein YuzE